MLPASSCVAGTSLGRFLHMLMVQASDPLYTCVDGASLCEDGPPFVVLLHVERKEFPCVMQLSLNLTSREHLVTT
jgi:hypothetical protein